MDGDLLQHNVEDFHLCWNFRSCLLSIDEEHSLKVLLESWHPWHTWVSNSFLELSLKGSPPFSPIEEVFDAVFSPSISKESKIFIYDLSCARLTVDFHFVLTVRDVAAGTFYKCRKRGKVCQDSLCPPQTLLKKKKEGQTLAHPSDRSAFLSVSTFT